jgi:hypothetical protein
MVSLLKRPLLPSKISSNERNGTQPAVPKDPATLHIVLKEVDPSLKGPNSRTHLHLTTRRSRTKTRSAESCAKAEKEEKGPPKHPYPELDGRRLPWTVSPGGDFG